MILALDPSSTRTGYAVLTTEGRLLEAGVAKPSRKRDTPWVRACAMAVDLESIAEQHDLTAVVVEQPAPQQGKGRDGQWERFSQRGQATYGFAAGVIADRLLRTGAPVQVVRADEWSRGRAKERRAIEIEKRHPGYDRSQDPGRDAADAIGMGEWFIRQRRLEEEKA